MDIDMIQAKYKNLNMELKTALSTMEKSNRVIVIRNAIKELQSMCPHNNGTYDFTESSDCPYCGKIFKR